MTAYTISIDYVVDGGDVSLLLEFLRRLATRDALSTDHGSVEAIPHWAEITDSDGVSCLFSGVPILEKQGSLPLGEDTLFFEGYVDGKWTIVTLSDLHDLVKLSDLKQVLQLFELSTPAPVQLALPLG